MRRRVLIAIAWGLSGLLVALVLTVGAFAIAGQEISQPAGVPVFTARAPDEDRNQRAPHEDDTIQPPTAARDQGGSVNTGTGSASEGIGSSSGNAGGGSESSEEGPGDDLRDSDDSGSGSDDDQGQNEDD